MTTDMSTFDKKNKKKCSTAMCFPREPSPPLCTLTSSNHQKCEIKKKVLPYALGGNYVHISWGLKASSL